MGGGSVYRQAMEAGVADLLVVTTIDLDVAARPEGAVAPVLVRAPEIGPAQWERDEEDSDVPGTWRPRSGDAAWRVDVWRRRA